MGNFKVKVNSEAESKEAQDLAIQSGYEMDDLFCQNWNDDFCYLLLCKDMSAGFGNEIMADGDKSISIAELRDMVFLKRNDVNDATHESSIYKYFKACDDWYYFDLGCTDKWQKSAGAKPEYYEKLREINTGVPNTEQHEQPSLNDQYLEIEQVRQTLNERQSQYGSFKDVADTTQKLMATLMGNTGYSCIQVEALHMICSKLARIANGDPNHVDSWHDIAGYATLVVDDLES